MGWLCFAFITERQCRLVRLGLYSILDTFTEVFDVLADSIGGLAAAERKGHDKRYKDKDEEEFHRFYGFEIKV
jgi:hypothetical protein